MEVILALLGIFLFLVVPILVVVLWGKVTALEEKVRRLSSNPVAQPAPPQPMVAQTPVAVPVTPPPMPAPAVPSAAVPLAAPRPAPSQPTPAVDAFAGLRDMGLLPPTDLVGEFALGSWWAVRVGGALAVAAVVFLGIWLNLRSTLPAWVRLGEILALGALGLWGGHRLEQTRRDLGRVVFAAGLTVLQFAAWATYGMEKMRVLETPAQAAILQFLVALAVGGVALARKDKLVAQLSIAFTTVAVGLSVHAGSDVLTIGVEAGSVAALGAVLLSRGGWASSAVLGLVGAQLGLMVLYDGRPNSPALTGAVQLGAAITFLSLWLADRFGRVESSFDDVRKNAFLCAAFFLPASTAVWVAVGGEDARAWASLILAAVAVAVGGVELVRRRLAAEIILSSALVFAAAAGAWKVEQHLVWAVWVVAAALTQLIFERTRLTLLVWVAEAFAAAALLAYLQQSPAQPWLRLLAPALIAALAAWRFEWGQEPLAAWNFRRFLSLVGLGLFVCVVLEQFPKVDQPWAWMVVVPVAVLFRRPKILWALVPAFAWSHLVVLSAYWRSNPEGVVWPLVWSVVLAFMDGAVVWLLNRWETTLVKSVQTALAFGSALLLMKAIGSYLNLPSEPFAASLCPTVLWLAGAVALFAWAEAFRRLTARPYVAVAALAAFLPTFLFFSNPWTLGVKSLALTPLWLAGFGLLLWAVARQSAGWVLAGTLCRSVLGFAFGVIVLVAFDGLPGAGVSLFWALAAALVFLLGFVLATRSYRMLGVAGLVVATGHVILHDVHDILGRIVACAAVAVAFFGVAWLYGKVMKKDEAKSA